MQLDNSIVFNNLKIGYSVGRGNRFPVISAQVNRAELIVLMGKNGAGKSTLLRTLAGLQPALGGELKLMGKNLNRYSQKERAALISFVSTERINIQHFTVFNLVSAGRYAYTNWLGSLHRDDLTVIDSAMQMAGIAHLTDKYISEISDGELQRVMIARTLAQGAPIIILDEPTAFLDLPNKFSILLLLRNLAWRENKTIILSTHDLDLAARIADNIWLLTPDTLKQGAPEDFALNAGFDGIFADTGISYDYQNGTVESATKFTGKTALACADPNLRFWTCKALNRIQLEVADDSNAADLPLVKAADGKFVYCTYNTEKTFPTLYALSKYLRESGK
jgi:iron complex transport system ATP-binding protein